jgi:hypothetical protein
MQFRFSNLTLRKRLFASVNIAAGLVAFELGLIAIVFGDYESLAARQASEGLLNTVAVGGLVYAAVFWIFRALGQPCVVRNDSSS